MAYKLLEMAQHRWRRLNSAHLLPLVRAGVTFIDGVQPERNKEEDRKEGRLITRIADPQLLTMSPTGIGSIGDGTETILHEPEAVKDVVVVGALS